MNDGQFQQLLEMVASAGEGGFVLAVIYLLEGYFYAVIWTSCIAFLTVTVGRLLKASSDEERALRDLWRYALPGHPWNTHSTFDETRRRKLFDALKAENLRE